MSWVPCRLKDPSGRTMSPPGCLSLIHSSSHSPCTHSPRSQRPPPGGLHCFPRAPAKLFPASCRSPCFHSPRFAPRPTRQQGPKCTLLPLATAPHTCMVQPGPAACHPPTCFQGTHPASARPRCPGRCLVSTRSPLAPASVCLLRPSAFPSACCCLVVLACVSVLARDSAFLYS